MQTEKTLDTIVENLAELSRREDINKKQKSLCLSLFVKELLENTERPKDTIFREVCRHMGGNLSAADKAEICKIIAGKGSIVDINTIPPFFNTDTPVTPGSHGKIAYVRNRYNDLAYEKLSEIIPHAKPIYVSSFEECADTVMSGTCEFAIIPIEDSSDGKMFGFYSLLDRYELRLSAVCTIDNDNSSKAVRYALVGRNFFSEKTEKLDGKRTKIFEFSLTYGADNDPFDTLCAAAQTSADIAGISSVFMPYNDTQTRFYYSLKISDSTNLYALLLYLWAEYPQYTPIGIYYEI